MRCAAVIFLAGIGLSTLQTSAYADDSKTKESGGPGEAATDTLIGGPFELLGHTGKVVRSSDFRGRYMLIYLGYTFCPDVCPTDLQAISTTLELMGEKAKRVQPIFITIDPARDTVEVLAAYVASFHPRLIGLTGNEKQVGEVARAFGAKYYKVMTETQTDSGKSGAETRENEGEEEYLLVHSTAIYLLGPDGEYIGHFSQSAEPDSMAEDLARIVQ